MARIANRGIKDWCHICGKESGALADIAYPKNASKDKENACYIRICSTCADKILTATVEPEFKEEV